LAEINEVKTYPAGSGKRKHALGCVEGLVGQDEGETHPTQAAKILPNLIFLDQTHL